MNQGSIVPKFMIGITDNFMLGMSFGISHFIGTGDIEKFRSYPEVQIKYRLFDETEKSIKVKYGVSTTYLPNKLITFWKPYEGNKLKVKLPMWLLH